MRGAGRGCRSPVEGAVREGMYERSSKERVIKVGIWTGFLGGMSPGVWGGTFTFPPVENTLAL